MGTIEGAQLAQTMDAHALSNRGIGELLQVRARNVSLWRNQGGMPAHLYLALLAVLIAVAVREGRTAAVLELAGDIERAQATLKED